MASNTLTTRVTLLENEMKELKTDMITVKTTLIHVEDNSSEILAFLTATKGIGAFFAKHGPRIVAFGFGIAASAGIVNPQVGTFIRMFFGFS